MQSAGPGTVDRKARLETLARDPPIREVRRADHRRHRLRAADARGDGGPVHTLGRALRTRQRAANEQSAVLEVGADLQGPDDHGRRNRPPGPSQRDPRTERKQLSIGCRERSNRDRAGDRRRE